MNHLSNPDQAPGNGHPQTRRARAAAASECVGGGDGRASEIPTAPQATAPHRGIDTLPVRGTAARANGARPGFGWQ